MITTTLTNGGTIGGLSDLAIASGSLFAPYLPAGGGVAVENNGTVSGFVTFTATTGSRQNVFNNNVLFDVRNFTDTNGDGVRDVKAVSASDFGGPKPWSTIPARCAWPRS